MKILLCVLILIELHKIVNSNPAEDDNWRRYKSDNKKAFTSDEDERRKVYITNLKLIEQHNKDFRAGKITFELGVNHFADLNPKEFRQRAKGLLKGRKPGSRSQYPRKLFARKSSLPKSLDYRAKGWVSQVNDQKSCGSCYSFAANGALEGQIAKMKGKVVNLSEQYVVDCSRRFGNLGCGGGLAQDVYRFVQKRGIALQMDYKYTGRNGACKRRVAKAAIKVVGSKNLPRGSEAALKSALVNVGPISIAVDSSKNSFRFYKSGVYYDRRCKSNYFSLDHAVLLVGYGTTPHGQPYWIIKNSWGTDWGMDGYMYLTRGKNHCGVATDASYPVVK